MAKYCRYCGRQLQENEICSCQTTNRQVNIGYSKERLLTMEKINRQEYKTEGLAYTNTVKSLIIIRYICNIASFMLLGYILFNTYSSITMISIQVESSDYTAALIIVEVICALLGYLVAKFSVAQLGMQMEMSQNLNLMRMYLKNIDESLFKLRNEQNK